MYLIELMNGESAVVEKLPEGVAREKLLEIGLHEGMRLEKISGIIGGKLVTVGVGERYFAITNDIAEKIRVKRMK